MGRVALRGLLAHKVRMAMTLAAVALGVAFVAGVLVLTDTLQRSFDDLFASVYEGTDAVVRSDEEIEGAGGPGGGTSGRGTLDEEVLATVRDVPSVAAASGDVEGFAQIIGPDGDVVGGAMAGAPTIAVNWDREGPTADELNPFGLRSGRWPARDDEIVIDVATARITGYAPGDTVPVQTSAGRREYTLVGTVGFGSADSAAGASVVVFTTREAQRTVGEPGRLSSITVVAREGVSQREVVADVHAALDGDVEVLTGEEIVDETSSELGQSLSFLTTLLLAFAVIAVVVGAFVIYNSFSIVVAQRAREMALLRALGASRRQIRASVLVEAILIGVAGSLAGFALGLGLAGLVSGLVGTETGLAVLPTSVLVALAVGIVVTVVSSLWPAWRAARVPPVAAMREIEVDQPGQSRLRLIAGIVPAALGAALSAAGMQTAEVLMVGIGVGLVVLGVIVGAPWLARPVASALGWPLARLRGMTGTLARQNAVRNPRRTAATGLALTIGIGIVAFFLVLNASLRSSIDSVLEENFAGDFVVGTGSWGMVGLPEEVGQRLAALDEVATAVPYRITGAQVGDSTAFVAGTSPAAFDLYGAEMQEGSAGLGVGRVVLADSRAEDLGVGVGDQVRIAFLDADPVDLTVTGIYEADRTVPLGGVVLGLDEYVRHVHDTSDLRVTVELAPGVTATEGRRAMEDVVSETFPTAEVQDVTDVREAMASELDGILLVVLALLAVTIVIAVVGIANTIALSVMERTRELGLLRAVGASRGQVRATIRWESAIIALFGAVLGLAIGVLGGYALVRSLAGEGFETFSLPAGLLALVAVMAVVLGVGAAVLPAWRAGRLNILAAIHTE